MGVRAAEMAREAPAHGTSRKARAAKEQEVYDALINQIQALATQVKALARAEERFEKN